MSLAVACEDGGAAQSPPSPVKEPVVDSAPYLCELVPERAFRAVTALSAPLTSDWDGPQTDNGLCLALAEKKATLGLVWSYRDGEGTVRFQRKKWADNKTYALPPDLGEGLAVVIPTAGAVTRPNYVIALFRCGKKRPWISIDFVPVVRGRDAVRDMFDFMRIAEKRFGEIHKCTPRPS
ncbi:Uncharacterised protein [Mycobacterium tuberculosis]|nr:Uncharacterised protein [Mycobacterium tuberculosis]